jgi:hypothetical protein
MTTNAYNKMETTCDSESLLHSSQYFYPFLKLEFVYYPWSISYALLQIVYSSLNVFSTV